MYAHDWHIKIGTFADMLQEDINNLANWSSESFLQFNETKCKAQSITRKINSIATTYSMKDVALS